MLDGDYLFFEDALFPSKERNEVRIFKFFNFLHVFLSSIYFLNPFFISSLRIGPFYTNLRLFKMRIENFSVNGILGGHMRIQNFS